MREARGWTGGGGGGARCGVTGACGLEKRCCNARSPPKDTYSTYTYTALTHDEQWRLEKKRLAQYTKQAWMDGCVCAQPAPVCARDGPPNGERPAARASSQDGTAGTGGGGSVSATAAVPGRPARYTRCNW